MSDKPYLSDFQYFKFSAYGFLKNLRFFDAFLLLYFLDIGLSYSQIGILYAVREWVINIAEIPSGLLADVYGRKYVLIFAFGLYIFSFITFYYSNNFYLLLMAMMLYGIGDAFRSGTHKGMIMDYLKSKGWGMHKVEYYGHTRSWSQKGSAISALIAGVIVLYSGNYRIVYLFAIVPYLLNFINIISYPAYLNRSGTESKEPKSKVFSVAANFWAAIKDKNVFPIMHSAALHSSFLKAGKDYIQPIMVNVAMLLPILATLDLKNKSGIVIGIIYFIIYLLTSYASKQAFRVNQTNIRHIHKKTLIAGLASGVICGWMMWHNMWVWALIAFIFIYIIENLRKPILTGALADNVKGEILTSVLSAQSFYGTLVTSSIAIMLGVFTDLWGIGIALSLVSGIFLVSSIFIKSWQ